MFVADTDTLFFMEHHFIATSLQLDYAFILLMFLLETQVQNGPHHSTPHFFHMISVIVPFSPVISAVSTPWTTGWKRLLHRLRNRSKKSKAKGSGSPEGTKLPSVQINVNHNIHYTSEIHNIFNMYIYIIIYIYIHNYYIDILHRYLGSYLHACICMHRGPKKDRKVVPHHFGSAFH